MLGDNVSMLQVMKAGRNPTMRHLGRTHRVSVAWLHEQHRRLLYDFVIRRSQYMAADIFTEAFAVGSRWLEVLDLIGITVVNDVKVNMPYWVRMWGGRVRHIKQEVRGL